MVPSDSSPGNDLSAHLALFQSTLQTLDSQGREVGHVSYKDMYANLAHAGLWGEVASLITDLAIRSQALIPYLGPAGDQRYEIHWARLARLVTGDGASL